MTSFEILQLFIVLVICFCVATLAIAFIAQTIERNYKRELNLRRMKMILNRDKIVDFTMCKSCKYEERDEHEEPCIDCLYEPVNQDTHKPVKWEEKE